MLLGRMPFPAVAVVLVVFHPHRHLSFLHRRRRLCLCAPTFCQTAPMTMLLVLANYSCERASSSRKFEEWVEMPPQHVAVGGGQPSATARIFSCHSLYFSIILLCYCNQQATCRVELDVVDIVCRTRLLMALANSFDRCAHKDRWLMTDVRGVASEWVTSANLLRVYLVRENGWYKSCVECLVELPSARPRFSSSLHKLLLTMMRGSYGNS